MPGSQSTSYPCIRARRARMSWIVLFRTCPSVRTPVILGGGMTMENGGLRRLRIRSEIMVLEPALIPFRFHRSRIICFGKLGHANKGSATGGLRAVTNLTRRFPLL